MQDPCLYLVRVWRRGPTIQASVRTADEQEPRLFTQAQPLGEFLLRTGSDDASPPNPTAELQDPTLSPR